VAALRWSHAPVFLLLAPMPVLGATSMAAPPHAPIQAVRASGPIHCDGILNEAAWDAAPPVGELYQQTPDQGAPITQKTEFRVLYDGAALYIGARLYDAHPESIQANLGRRDASLPADRISVYLDPYHDKRSGYVFVVNAAGLRVDGLLFNDGNQDLTWDGIWEARSHRDSLGWSAEMRIPFSQLRFQSAANQVWGINFKRVIVRRGEEALLAYAPRGESGFSSRFPDLVGLQGIAPSRAIEITPYMTGKSAFLRHAVGDPFNDGSQWDARSGLDLRAPVGRRLTLSATVNPDFGQVEVDPATVNLSDVETSFQEKRPYFVEGANNYRFGREGANSYWNFNWPEPSFFYSRRIGRAPQGAVPSNADYVDVPIATTILGAAKLTGKITPTVNFGTLQALTGRQEAALMMSGLRSSAVVEPLTYYQVTRALKEFKDRRAGLGVLGTGAIRKLDGSGLEGQLNSSSFAGGVDGWYFIDPKQVWALTGWAAASNVNGSATRMTAIQRSSRHYFQRPDANDVEVDPNATSLTGYAGRVWLNKQSGDIMSNTGIGFISPKFETNDLGLQSRSDVINAHTMLGYQWNKEGKIRRSANVWAAIAGNGDFDGDLTSAGLSLGGNVNYRNNWNQWFNAGVNPSTIDIRSTRGGPAMKSEAGTYLNFGCNSDNYKKTFVSPWVYFERDRHGSSANNGGFYVEWKPKSNLFISTGPWVNFNHVNAQYVTTAADPTATETYGNRYVFASLDQTTVGADLRLNWTFTPDLSLETYLQPFFSSGEYDDFKSLARPRTYAFDPYAFNGNINFDVASLRGNAVLRWEYAPGSTVFLVWTQVRDAFTPDGDFDLRRGMTDLFRARSDNVFLVKATYHVGL
jgi:hypothetical protein